MENTPVTDEVVVPKKNVLFEVTTLSKTIAAILFILMPFVGGYIGYKISNSTKSIPAIESPTETHTTDVSEVNVLRVRGESMPNRMLAYWCNESDINCLQHKSSIPNNPVNVTDLYAEYATSTYLLDLLYISESTSKAYFRTANERSEIVGLVSFDMNTKSFIDADELYGELEAMDIAYDGRYIAFANKERNEVLVSDLEKGVIINKEKVTGGTLQKSNCDPALKPADITITYNHQVRFQIYSGELAGSCEYKPTAVGNFLIAH